MSAVVAEGTVKFQLVAPKAPMPRECKRSVDPCIKQSPVLIKTMSQISAQLMPPHDTEAGSAGLRFDLRSCLQMKAFSVN